MICNCFPILPRKLTRSWTTQLPIGQGDPTIAPPTVVWWCKQCEQEVHAADQSHAGHKEKLVGIRSDIHTDYMKRLVRELDATGRLIKPQGK